jgi:hypothetical protein
VASPDWSGFSFEEVAAIRRDKPGTLGARVARALPLLRVDFESSFEDRQTGTLPPSCRAVTARRGLILLRREMRADHVEERAAGGLIGLAAGRPVGDALKPCACVSLTFSSSDSTSSKQE